MTMHEQFFETADFDLAATILATIGTPLIGLDRSDPYQVKFLFNRKDIIDEFVDAYWRGDLRVEPVTFSLIRRYLSQRLSEGPEDESLPTGFCM